jgi:protein TonB
VFMPVLHGDSKRAPISLLLFSQPPEETPSLARTTAAVTAAHALVLAIVLGTALLVRKPDLPGVLSSAQSELDVDFTALLIGARELHAAPGTGPRTASRVPARPRPRPVPTGPRLLGTPVLVEPAIVPHTIPNPPGPPAWSESFAHVPQPPLPDAKLPRGAERAAAAASAGNGHDDGNGGGNGDDVESLSLDELAREPRFTPFTQAPELVNRAEIKAFLQTRYQPIVSGRGIGGRAVLWLLIGPTGDIRKAVLLRSSGHGSLDDAALEAVDRMEFRPAINKGKRVPVWVQLPVSFQPDW